MSDEMNQIRAIAWSFHRSTGIEWDELVGVAGVGFAEHYRRYDPRFGAKVSTFAYMKMKHRLTEYVRKSRKRTENEVAVDELPDAPLFLTPLEICDFKFRVERSSIDAQTILGMIFESPQEFLTLAGRGAGRKIRTMLRGRGWTTSRIRQAVREVRALAVPVA